MKLRYTKLQIALEVVGALVGVAMLVFIITQWSQLPGQVPVHFNAHGEIDRMGNKSELLFLPIITIFIYGLITAVCQSPRVWNCPVKVTEQNRQAIYTRMRDMLICVKIEVLLLLFYVTVYSMRSSNMPVLFLVVSMVLLFGTILGFTIYISRLAKGLAGQQLPL